MNFNPPVCTIIGSINLCMGSGERPPTVAIPSVGLPILLGKSTGMLNSLRRKSNHPEGKLDADCA